MCRQLYVNQTVHLDLMKFISSFVVVVKSGQVSPSTDQVVRLGVEGWGGGGGT